MKTSGLIESYRHEHNSTKHFFSENGMVSSWIPEHKLAGFFGVEPEVLTFSQEQVKGYMKYGFTKTKATVSKKENDQV